MFILRAQYKQSIDLGQSMIVKSMIFTLERIKTFLISSSKVWGKLDASKLNEDIITYFGWHAKLEEETRHIALEDASEALGEPHIIRILYLMNNTWKEIENNRIHWPIANADYNWFVLKISQNLPYLRKKIQLREELKAECNEILEKAQPSFKELIKDINHIDHFLIVTY